jgi:hypothetical protein
MFSMRKGFPVIRDNAREVRRICPPPSPNDPSIVIMVLISIPVYTCGTAPVFVEAIPQIFNVSTTTG